MNICVFPGSFDPLTVGHVDIVTRAMPLFDKVVVALGENTQKKYLFKREMRMKWLHNVFDPMDKVEVQQYDGLTVSYCKKLGAKYMLRGIRNASDFDYEKTISQLNNIIGDGIETVFFISKPEYSHISSTIVRELIIGKGNVRSFIPEEIKMEDIENASK